MARGYCYEAVTDVDSAGFLSEEDLYDYAGKEFDYTEDLSADRNNETVLQFVEELALSGAYTTHRTGKDNLQIYGISFSKKAKEHYFETRLQRAKQILNNISLSDFASDSMELYRLRQEISHTDRDMVYLDGYLYNLDTFIRNAVPDKTYYISKAVFIK